ncbi:MAG TPA: LysM domain-containing protein [Pseudomonadales bacterium]|nr:LysM domain-containing protein [Pseudomonadales bacterium]
MKTISCWFLIFTLMAAVTPRVRAQDSATQQQLDQLSSSIQDIQSSLTQQNKRITDLESKISAMQDKLNTPGGNDYASSDDLKKLAQQVQEIDKKRQEDNQKILAALEKLGKGGGSGGSDLRHTTEVTPVSNPTENTSTPNGAGGQQNGYNYKIEAGNTISAIAKAYQAKGIKVTVKQILDANPGLDPKNLIVGKTIFIPAPQ